MASPAMRALFRFPDAVRRDAAVERWLEGHTPELRGLARRWFGALRACGDDVRELLHDGHPTACIGDAAFAYVNAFTAHVNVGFYCGAALPDPERLLTGSGRFMRHVKLHPGASTVDPDALARLIRAAYDDAKARLAVEDSEPRARA